MKMRNEGLNEVSRLCVLPEGLQIAASPSLASLHCSFSLSVPLALSPSSQLSTSFLGRNALCHRSF